MTTKPVLLATCTSVRAETSLCNGVKASVQLPFRVDSPGTANYLCDSTTPASAVLKDGAAVYTPGLSERRGTTSKFYHGDALGSTRGITNSSQAVTDSVLYDGFGMTVSRTGTTPTPFGFVGKGQYQTDSDSGLQLLGHRYYDASVGRFISSDPAKAGDNWYAYCDNNPLKETDATGLDGDDPPPGHIRIGHLPPGWTLPGLPIKSPQPPPQKALPIPYPPKTQGPPGTKVGPRIRGGDIEVDPVISFPKPIGGGLGGGGKITYRPDPGDQYGLVGWVSGSGSGEGIGYSNPVVGIGIGHVSSPSGGDYWGGVITIGRPPPPKKNPNPWGWTY